MVKYLYGQDNKLEVLRDREDVAFCPNCNSALNKFAAGFKRRAKPKYDVSCTYEGLTVVSPWFANFLNDTSTSEVVYHPLPSGFFVLQPKRSVFLDISKLGPHIETCSRCGRWRSATGLAVGRSEHVQLIPKQREIAGFDIVRSKQEFGPMGGMCFSILIGDQLAQAIKDANFTGVYIG